MAKNHKRAPRKSRFTKDEAKMIKKINVLIAPRGTVTGLGPNAVGVFGDARYVGLAVTLRLAEEVDYAEISTLVTNRVRGIARVLMDL